MPKVMLKSEVEVDLDMLAECFAALNDDEQTQFFVKVAEIAKSWPFRGESQWWYIGSHLRNCECSSEEARDMIRSIAEGIERGTHT